MAKSRKRRSYRRNPTMLAGNPKRRTARRGRRSMSRRNPVAALRAYGSGLTSTPTKVMGLFKGRDKVKNSLYAAGGAVATYLVGGLLGGKLGELFARIPGVGTTVIGQRILPALIPYTVGFVGSRFVKQQNMKTALMVGGGLASIIELLMPGKVGQLVNMIPGVRNIAMSQPIAAAAEAGPVAQAQEGIGRMMLAGYVSAPSYAGSAGLAEYVTAPSYQGSAGLGQEMLAGNYLEDSSMFQPAI